MGAPTPAPGRLPCGENGEECILPHKSSQAQKEGPTFGNHFPTAPYNGGCVSVAERPSNRHDVISPAHLLPIKHASNGLMWACVRPCDCDTCCDPPSCLGVGGRALCLHDAQVKSSPLSIHKQQTPTKGRAPPCGAPIYRMCSGSQLWWKGVGGDDGGDTSRGDTSHEGTHTS